MPEVTADYLRASLDPVLVASTVGQAALQIFSDMDETVNALRERRLSRVAADRIFQATTSAIPEVTRALTPWLESYAARADGALAEINPLTAANFSYFSAASRRVTSQDWLADAGLRSVVWMVAAAGGGDSRPGRGLPVFLQATADWRGLAMLLELIGSASPADGDEADRLDAMTISTDLVGNRPGPRLAHGHLMSIRARFGWCALRIAVELAEAVGDREVTRAAIMGLAAYVDQAGNSDAWSRGELDTIALTRGARELAINTSLLAGEMAGTPFTDLLSTRRVESHPFVRVGDLVVPAAQEILATKLHLAIFGLLRRRNGHKSVARAFEQAATSILADVAELRLLPGQDINLAVSDGDPGEVDFAATDGRSYLLLGEVKSRVIGEEMATSAESFDDQIGKALQQISLRRDARDRGVALTVDGVPYPVEDSARIFGLVVVLHEYSGAVWSSADVTRAAQLRGAAVVSVLPMTDLALIVATIRDREEFFEYLTLRDLFLSQPAAMSCDEIDMLALFLETGSRAISGMIRDAPPRAALTIPPRDVPRQLLTAFAAPVDLTEWRRTLAGLPRVHV